MKPTPWINTISFVSVITFNLLADLLPLGGRTTGEISNQYPSLLTPAPYTFSIWGVIYLLMAIFVFSRFQPISHRLPGEVLEVSIHPWFMVSCLMNICWLLCWHSGRIGLSILPMAGLVLSVLLINVRLDRFDPLSIWDRLSVYGFQIYLGWVFAAFAANIGVWITKAGKAGSGIFLQAWVIGVLILFAVTGIIFTVLGHQYFTTLAIVWASVGILVKHLGPNDFGGTYYSIITALILAITAMLLSIYLTIPLPSRSVHIE